MSLSSRLDRYFHLTANNTTVRTEAAAGVTTFLTMAYIIFVQPAVLGSAGMDVGAVMMATCLGTAFATLLMAFMANYPIAVAPGMGHNFFFAYTVVQGMQVPWQSALGAVAIAGAMTAGLVAIRERLLHVIPDALKHAIAAGIGLLIATIGLQWAGLVVGAPGTLVTLGELGRPATLLSIFGLAVTAGLVALRIHGAFLIGILASAAAGLSFGLVNYEGLVGPPPSLAPTLFQLDIVGALAPGMISVILVFFFLDLFDSVGTLIAVSHQAGLVRNGTLPRARQALLADAIGTVGGAALGTSTLTSYIESATGVASGGRTGLTAVVTAALFGLSTFFAPFVRMIGGGVQSPEGLTLYPIVAPALVLVGVMMMRNVRLIDWEDPVDAIPAFLTMVIMPLSFSITEGLAFGFIACSLLRILTRRASELHWLLHLFALVFLIRYIALR
jgi:AGZA family xanthine/uracil permease-like MFS transporter